uniref:Uncharacterized protein n=1 Tax=Ditylenchus dipsaci TaxID=166011 RepID=A0A915D871_9BILA
MCNILWINDRKSIWSSRMNEQASNLSGDSNENSAVSIFDPMTGTGEKVSRSGGPNYFRLRSADGKTEPDGE